MAKVYALQTNFTSGAISKSAQARTDLTKYGNSVDELENYVITKRGGILPRAGTVYVAEIKDITDPNTILIPFTFSTSISFIIEAGDQYFRFYKDEAQVLDGNNPYEIATPFTSAELADVRFVQAYNKMILVHPDHEPQQLVYSPVLETFTLNTIVFNYPAMTEQGDIPDCTLTIDGTTFETDVDTFIEGDEGREIGAGTGLAKIITYVNAQEVEVEILIAFDEVSYVSGDWKLLQSPLTKIVASQQTAGAENVYIITGFFNASGEIVQNGINAFRKAPYSFTDVGKLLKVDGGLIEITSVSSGKMAMGKILRTLTEDDDPSTTYPNPAYGGGWQFVSSEWDDYSTTGLGYPSVCGMFEGRLILASNRAFPNRVWGSKVGNNYDFFTGVEDDNPFEFDVASERYDEVTGINALKELIIRTTGSEYAVNGQNNGPIAPTNTSVKRQSSYGSANVLSAPMESGFAFVQRAGKSVYFYNYDFNINGFDGDDTTDLNQDITQNGVNSLAFEQYPYQHLYCVTEEDSGEKSIAVLCIDRKQEVVGWSKILGGEGTQFFYVTTIPTETKDQTWCIAQINGRLSVCYFDYETSFDGYVTTTSALPTTSWTGLTHLASSEVTILLDGQPHFGIQVDSNGALTTPYAGRVLEAGYFYVSRCKMLPAEMMLEGSIQGRKSSVNRIYVKLLETQTLNVETARGVDQQIEFRQFGNNVLDQEIEPYTGIKEISILGSGNNLTWLVLKREAPLKQHILSINRMITVND